MTVLVTGSDGFIGRNLCSQLEQGGVKILRFDRNNTLDELKKSITLSSFIFHFAGVNRPKDNSEFDTGNRGLTETILKLISDSGKKIPMLITSSIQAELNNPYGKSKKAAEEAMLRWSSSTGNTVYVYRLPNVFGKWSRPEYNSVVATFCHHIANDLEITINDPSTKLTLVYIDDVIREFVKTMNGRTKKNRSNYYSIQRQFVVTLDDLAKKLYAFKESRSNLTVPSFQRNFDRFLYATYSSYFDESDFGYDLEMKRDQRGWLAEFIKSGQFGQIFISRTKPGITRGNHWHHTKIEKFLVIDGEGEVRFRKLGSDGVLRYRVSGGELKVIDIPAGYVHSLVNIGKTDLLTLFWADEIFNNKVPDTYYEEV